MRVSLWLPSLTSRAVFKDICLFLKMAFNCTYFVLNQVGDSSVNNHIEALGDFGLGFLIYGSISTIILIGLFVFSLLNVVRKSPPKWRRLLTWIVSMPMIVSILSWLTFVVPGTAILCDTVKQSYLPFLLMHFIDLSLAMEGGHTGSLEGLKKSEVQINFCRPPWCCVGICLKNINYTKKNMRIMKGLVYQTPLVQLVINLLITILETAGVLQRRVVNAAFACLGVTNILFFTMGMYGYNVLTTGFGQVSQWKSYALKARVLFICVVILKVQTLILLLVGVGGGIPCVEPYVSPVVMRKCIDASLCLIECLLFGIIFYPVFRVVDNDIRRLETQTSVSTPSVLSVNLHM